MRKLDQRGVAALEFCLVAVPIFTLMFAIFDFGRYAITMQSLRMLANAGARAVMTTYDPTNKTYTGCTGDPLSDADKQARAPFAFVYYDGGLKPPKLNAELVAGVPTMKASQEYFTMLMPIWGGVLDAPSASTSIPFCGS